MNKIINWMGGWPKDGLVSASEWEERLAQAADRYRRESAIDGPEHPAAPERLKELLASGLLKAKTNGQSRGMRLAAGADAALSRLTERSLAPGDVVLAERLTSRSALQTFRKAGIRVEAVERDEAGMVVNDLKSALSKYRPRLVYIAPACSDPEGKVWPANRRAAVAEACRDAGVLLLRDDRQEMLVYDGGEESGIMNLEPTTEGVLSIGQLPPGLVAGFRFGWAVGKAEELDRWIPSRSAVELSDEPGVTPIECIAFAELLQDQPLEPLLDMLRVQCRARMRRMSELLKQRLASEVAWRNPEGGVHLWLTLPDGLDGEALLRGAWLKGLMFQPGTPFYATLPKRNKIRLTFAGADERQMKLGAARLSEAIGEFLGRHAGG